MWLTLELVAIIFSRIAPCVEISLCWLEGNSILLFQLLNLENELGTLFTSATLGARVGYIMVRATPDEQGRLMYSILYHRDRSQNLWICCR